MGRRSGRKCFIPQCSITRRIDKDRILICFPRKSKTYICDKHFPKSLLGKKKLTNASYKILTELLLKQNITIPTSEIDQFKYHGQITRKCILTNCNTSNISQPKIKMFPFPKHETEMYKLWINNYLTLSSKQKLRASKFICINHFKTEYIRNNKLIYGAIPTENLIVDPITMNITNIPDLITETDDEEHISEAGQSLNESNFEDAEIMEDVKIPTQLPRNEVFTAHSLQNESNVYVKMTNNDRKMLCRACLCDNQEVLQPFLDNSINLTIYTSCTYLQINMEDSLSRYLCSVCVDKCVSWNLFKEMCTQNELLLKRKLNPLDISVNCVIKPEEIKTVQLKELRIFDEKISTTVAVKNEIFIEEFSLADANFNGDGNSFDNPDNLSEPDQQEKENKKDVNEHQIIVVNEICTNCGKLFSQQSELLEHIEREKCKLKCEICNKTFKRLTQMRNHIICHMRKKFKCKICYKKYYSKYYLSHHTSRAHTFESADYKCDLCEKIFLSKEKIKCHLKTHLNDRPYKCRICVKSFKTKDGLSYHMSCHTKDRPYSCPQCDKLFILKAKLEKHFQYHLEKSILCDICGQTFRFRENLKTHMLKHSSNVPYKCSVCDKGIKTKSALTKHMSTHTNDRPFSCKLCNKCYKNQGQLNGHIRNHTGEKRYKCTECEKCFYVNSQLKTHMRIHTGEKPYVCKVCYKSFTSSGVLRQHMLSHSSDRPFQCDLCENAYNRKSFLAIHINRIHLGIKPFECEICEKSFTLKHSLNMHMEIHENDKKFNCTVCDKSFSIEENFNYHLRIHDVDHYKRYLVPKKCTICNKILSTKSSLNCHMKIHLGVKAHKCSLCSKSFKSKAELNRHNLNIHTNEKPFKCDKCDKPFKRKAILNEHIKVRHMGQAPKCTLCNKTYANKVDLVIHMRSHTGERPFSCTLCYKAFDANVKLKRHMLTHGKE